MVNSRQSFPLVSIIIVTFNSQQYIKRCLESVYKTDYPVLEVIAVDNGSTDKTLKIIQENFPSLRIILSGNNSGYAGGNNLGVKHAKGEYLAILNPDAEVTKDWLKLLIAASQSTDVAVCQPKIMLSECSSLINLTEKLTHFLGFEWLADYRRENYKMSQRAIGSFSGCAFVIKKTLFAQLGGFDESFFMYYEDGDLSWKIRLKRLRILLIPDSIVYHEYKFNPNENEQKTRRKFYYLERNRLIMITKNYSLKTLLLLLPAIVFMEIGMHLYFISKGWFFEKWQGYCWIGTHLGQIMNNRCNIQTSRKISDSEIVKSFQGSIMFEEFDNIVLKYLVNPLLNLYWKIASKLI